MARLADMSAPYSGEGAYGCASEEKSQIGPDKSVRGSGDDIDVGFGLRLAVLLGTRIPSSPSPSFEIAR